MHTLFDRAARAGLLYRIDRLQPESPRQWGKMSVREMLAHAGEQLRMSLGDVVCADKPTPFNRPVLRQLIVFVLPWPKGSPTAPELLLASPVEVEEGKAALSELIGRFAEHEPSEE